MIFNQGCGAQRLKPNVTYFAHFGFDLDAAEQAAEKILLRRKSGTSAAKAGSIFTNIRHG